MNNDDRNAIAKLELAVKEIHKTVEIIKTNDLPHIDKKIDAVEERIADAQGKLSVLSPLVIATLTILIGAIIGFVVLA